MYNSYRSSLIINQVLIDLINKHQFEDGKDQKSLQFLDIGCGSGAIALSLLRENSKVCTSITSFPSSYPLSTNSDVITLLS